jgi:penicillin-binding protein A
MAIAGGVLCIAPIVARYTGASAQDLKQEVTNSKGELKAYTKNVTPPPLTGIDLAKITIEKNEAHAPAYGKRKANLTIVPQLQEAAYGAMKYGKIPEAAVVVLDIRSGRVLVYANQVTNGPAYDVAAASKAPAASIFKIVTGSSLVEHAQLKADTKQCYWGGLHGITKEHLHDNERKDKLCATLSEAMGRSLNVVFGRLAIKHLKQKQLEHTAKLLGFGVDVPFDVPVEKNLLQIPEEELGFARTSAGFWNTTMSPLSAAILGATVANQGRMVRPYIVDSVSSEMGVIYKSGSRHILRQAISSKAAHEVGKMMEFTVPHGTGRKTFYDGKGRPYLPNIAVAGKTGTLIAHKKRKFYTWFVGYAPAEQPEIAIASLAANDIKWHVKANWVAREVLRAYFALKGAEGVTTPRYLS